MVYKIYIAVIALALVIMLALNIFGVITPNTMNWAIIQLGNGELIEGHAENIHTHGEYVHFTLDGIEYYTNASNVIFSSEQP